MLLALILSLGLTDARVTQDNIATTICHPGYSRSVRPPQRVTAKIKREMGGQGLILDHIVPIEAGGDPSDRRNLQLQTKAQALAKDRLEHRTHAQICAGKITLEEGQSRFTQGEP